jgi:nucleoside-diphosphate-sugar epimerase/glycosyltransferase involved in cell wall biosynthesis
LKERSDVAVRIVDIAPLPFAMDEVCHEFILGDLRDPQICRGAVRGAHTVLHFAANMGGMGAIHDQNDIVLYNENHITSMNIIQAAQAANVSRFFFASSACVYHEDRQSDPLTDVSLCEFDAYPPGRPTRTQGCYGLEKFNTENFLHNLSGDMGIRIARFHNIYGPGGAWNNGREKAPAAMLRKACAFNLLSDDTHVEFEIWGDGSQRRSFLFIDDAVDAILKLVESDVQTPLNIGSDSAVTIRELAEKALRLAGVDQSRVTFSFDPSQPVGVASRNSNNDQVRAMLGWSPCTTLESGMAKTLLWIEHQISDQVSEAPDRETALRAMTSSLKLDLRVAPITYGILLPVTSLGSTSQEDCLTNLRRFAISINDTTKADTRLGSSGDTFSFKVYIAVDKVDEYLLPGSNGELSRAERVLRDQNIFNIEVLVCDHPRGQVCNHWRDCARRAHDDQCDYMVLMGDDVVLEDEGWMRKAHAEFLRLVPERNVPMGFGCVAFTDISFPGMPTFPIISRTHMKIFNGTVVPDVFINQDGDPFLFQLYRRWGCSSMIPSRISNGIGGEHAARYEKKSASNWTFGPLTTASSSVQQWLDESGYHAKQKVTLDIIIPCYRVDVPILDTILALQPSTTCAVMFIIIVDDPTSPFVPILENKYAHQPDIRIRVNKSNLGASASRNRGLKESASDWVHFLDDDVVPQKDLLIQDEKAIRAHPLAAGFVGTTVFPRADSIFTTAVHLAGVTYFWDIANGKLDSTADVPWGVTANLIARRSIPDGVEFNLLYPKTGGGEDIHFCREKREASCQNGGEAFYAAPEVKATHPWWNNGRRSYWRFYNWSVGDGALIQQFPQYRYCDFSPNSAESLFLCTLAGLVFGAMGRQTLVIDCLRALVSVFLANILHDLYRHLLRHPNRNAILNTSLRQRRYALHWILAILESSLIRMFSECGRVQGILVRCEFTSFGQRFDWFTDRCGAGPRSEERANGIQRFALSLLLLHAWKLL